MDAGDSEHIRSSAQELASTVAVSVTLVAVDLLGTVAGFRWIPQRAPTAFGVLSPVSPKAVHRPFHSLCVLNVTGGVVLCLFTRTAPAV